MSKSIDNKSAADALRDLADRGVMSAESRTEIWEIADRLDPIRPKRGTIVWWRATYSVASKTWQLGEVEPDGIYAFATEACFKWDEVEWKPARIAGPMQTIVDVPPVSEWDCDAERITVWGTITRAEAERMEADK